jgi:MerR family transcriptional regulator, light-induced transcriptional regulator
MQVREAADTLGVHYQTAYAWVRQGTLPARKTGRGYDVSHDDVSALAAHRASGTPPRPEVRVRDWPVQADRLYDAIVSGDETLARHDLDRLARGVPLIDLCERVFAPALRRVGQEWTVGRLSIAAEHRASAICERLIAARVHQPPGRPRGIAVTATPPGERHALPALMAAACLREDRWLVHHLAADLPVAEAIGLALEVGADLVVLSSATDQTARAARRAAREIGSSAPRLRVLAGRPGDSLSRLRELARGLGRPGQRSASRSAKSASWSRCSDRWTEAGATTRRSAPRAACWATSSAVISIDPQRVTCSASGSRPASRAAARMSLSWLARSASVSRPPGKYPSPRRPARRAAAGLDPPTCTGSGWRGLGKLHAAAKE